METLTQEQIETINNICATLIDTFKKIAEKVIEIFHSIVEYMNKTKIRRTLRVKKGKRYVIKSFKTESLFIYLMRNLN